MYTRIESLKYTKNLIDVLTYDSGLELWQGVDEIYNQMTIRNKVVCKLDLLLTFSNIFTKDTVVNYRDILMMLFNRTYEDENELSEILQAVMEADKVFGNRVGNIFYSLRPTESLGNKLLGYLSDRVLEQDSFYRSYFRNKFETFMFISDAYLYFAVADMQYAVGIPYDVEVEVLSYAKNWCGEFRVTE